MRSVVAPIVILTLVLVVCGSVLADQVETQTVTIKVNQVNELAVTGGAIALTIDAGTTDGLTEVTNTGTVKYAILTNGTSKKIVGKVDSALPSGVRLAASLTAPAGGTSPGFVELTASDKDLVTGISKLKGANIGIAFRLQADPEAGVIAETSKTVTFTIVDGS